MRTIYVVLTVAAIAVSVAPCFAAPAAPLLPGNWNLAFDEEFNAPLDPSVWVSGSLWGINTMQGEYEVYDPIAATVSNGLLSLTASKQSIKAGYNYVSGVINTGPLWVGQPTGYSFLYGYAEARIKLVSGRGLWPAFWMLPAPNTIGAWHDQDGEIDVMEELGQQPTIDQVHLHLQGSAWGTGYNSGVDLSQGFHTYAVNWRPGVCDFYLDGAKVFTIDSAPSVPEYMILNMAVGGPTSWPGAPNGSTVFPATMQVDYVHVWQTEAPEPSMLSLVAIGAWALGSRRRASDVEWH